MTLVRKTIYQHIHRDKAMRKIILKMQISLDGIVSDVEQWMTMNDEMIEDILQFYNSLDAIAIGGRTYPSLAEMWQSAENSEGSELMRKFAVKINDIEKIVLSRSPVDLVWKNSRQLPADNDDSLIREINSLKNSKGKNISVESGAGVWHAFIRTSTFDDIWMFVHPVVVGKGTHLFVNNDTKLSMKPIKTKKYSNGVVGLYYQKREE